MLPIKNIAFLVGGYTKEFDVSLKSAEYVESQLVSDKYHFYKIIISKNDWYYTLSSGKKIIVDRVDFSLFFDGEKISFDGAFILMHGTPGEDGLIQGYLDLLNIPYPSCDRLSSTITFNKKYTNIIADANGIPVAKSLVLKKDGRLELDSVLKMISLPVFVKPNQGGSSLGTFKVTNENQLIESIQKSFDESEVVIVEELIPGREFTIGVVEWKGELMTLPISEVIAPNEFFDYEAKYTVGGCEEITPAQISSVMKLAIEESAKKIYQIFGCNGIVRVDYIWHDQRNAPYFLEVNTIPGMTATSFIPQQLEAMNWTTKQLILGLLEEMFAK